MAKKFDKKLAEQLKGGVIMDVVNVEQAQIAEKAGACAVMALERVPADIRAAGGVARMVSIDMFTTSGRWRVCSLYTTERPLHDQGDRRGRDHPCHGQGAHRALC